MTNPALEQRLTMCPVVAMKAPFVNTYLCFEDWAPGIEMAPTIVEIKEV